MKPDTEYIEKLAQLINEHGLTEISIEDESQAITIRKDAPGIVNVAPSVPASIQTTPVSQDSADADSLGPKPSAKGKTITSPMVGTFYASSSPDTEPFVEVGSEVKEGDVVCIIEAMKLMNEIKSEHAGKITQICVKNGDPIEYGQVLMYLE